MTAPTLTAAAADALRAAEATATTITLRGQLDRKTYVEVNKALTRLGGGGKWDRRAGAHVYPDDPRPDLAALIGDDGPVTMPDDKIKLASFWRTPPSLVDRMLNLAGVAALAPGAVVLEPSAGDGAIADAVRLVNPQVRLGCIEPDARRAAVLRAKGHDVIATIFEGFVTHRPTDLRPDVIVMNPPFTTPTDPKAWATHVDDAVDILAWGGTLVAVVPSSYTYGSARKILALRERITRLGGRYQELPASTFAESGTAVNTGLITLTTTKEGTPA